MRGASDVDAGLPAFDRGWGSSSDSGPGLAAAVELSFAPSNWIRLGLTFALFALVASIPGSIGRRLGHGPVDS